MLKGIPEGPSVDTSGSGALHLRYPPVSCGSIHYGDPSIQGRCPATES